MILALGGIAEMESILNSIKKALGPDDSYQQFDPELIMFINTVFGILFQLGVGPKDRPFKITGAGETWDQFKTNNEIETVKSYVFIKVKLLFDPPSSSFVLASYKELAQEFEWRCNVDSETP